MERRAEWPRARHSCPDYSRHPPGHVAVAMLGIAIEAAGALGGQSPWISDWLYCGLYLLAAAGCAHRARRGDAAAALDRGRGRRRLLGRGGDRLPASGDRTRRWYPRVITADAVHRLHARLHHARPAGAGARAPVDPVLALDGLLTGLAAAAVAALLLFPALGRRRLTARPRRPSGVPRRGAGRADVRRHGARHDRLAARASWALIATAIAINVARRRGPRAPDRHRALPSRLAGGHAVRQLGAAARAGRVRSQPLRHGPRGRGAAAPDAAGQRLGRARRCSSRRSPRPPDSLAAGLAAARSR